MVEWCERMSINWPNIFNGGGQTQTQTWVACFFFSGSHSLSVCDVVVHSLIDSEQTAFFSAVTTSDFFVVVQIRQTRNNQTRSEKFQMAMSIMYIYSLEVWRVFELTAVASHVITVLKRWAIGVFLADLLEKVSTCTSGGCWVGEILSLASPRSILDALTNKITSSEGRHTIINAVSPSFISNLSWNCIQRRPKKKKHTPIDGALSYEWHSEPCVCVILQVTPNQWCIIQRNLASVRMENGAQLFPKL